MCIYIYTHIYIYIPGSVYNAGVIPARCSLVVGCFAACCVLLLAWLLCCQCTVVPLTLSLAACLPALQCVGGVLYRCFAAGCPVCVAACTACFASCLVACIDFRTARLLTCVVLPVVWLGVLPVCWQKQQHGSMRYRGFYFGGVLPSMFESLVKGFLPAWSAL